MITRGQWGAAPFRNRASLNIVRRFVVHHTTGNHLGRDDSAAWVRAIQRHHMQVNRWADIAYNFLVDKDGNVFEGRGWDVIGAHTRNNNGNSIGVAFLGDGSLDVPEAAKASIVDLLWQAEERYGDLEVSGHGDLVATSCPGTVLSAWLKDGMPLKYGRLIVTDADTASLLQAQEWARSKNAAPVFVDSILPALHAAAAESREGHAGRGIDFAVLAAQSAKETGWGRFGGVLDTSFRNTAGIKVAAGGGNFDPDAHQRFVSWAEGARAHVNHLSAYVGLHPVGIPHGRYHVVRSLPWAGTITTVEQLGGRWAPNPAYGEDIVRMIAELHTVPEPVQAPPSDPVLRLGSEGPEVAQVQKWLFADGVFGTGTFDAVRAFQRRHGLVADGIVGPITWGKLREVYGG